MNSLKYIVTGEKFVGKIINHIIIGEYNDSNLQSY